MSRNKKILIASIIAVVAVVVISTLSVTYAWFLTSASAGYDFKLMANSKCVLQYESDITFEGGSDTSLVPATANYQAVGIQAAALTPFDMFYEAEDEGAKVAVSANCVSFTAEGGYWTGEGTKVGKLDFALTATLTGQDFDYVQDGEVAYAVIFSYIVNGALYPTEILYYNGSYYVRPEAAADVTTYFPQEISEFGWRELTEDYTVNEQQIFGVEEVDETVMKNILIVPNTEFAFTLKVFLAKTDEELDPALNGATLNLTATISVQDDAAPAVDPAEPTVGD